MMPQGLFGATPEAVASPPSARQPAFRVVALGVLGGDTDVNLSSFLIADSTQSHPQVMIDGGSVVGGIVKWKEASGKLDPEASWTVRSRVTMDVLRHVEWALITHSHLDHVAGFLQKSTIDLEMAQAGRRGTRVIGLPQTLEALETAGYSPPLWAAFTHFPEGNPAIQLQPLEPGKTAQVGPFTVRAFPLLHSLPCAAFLLESGPDAYLHLGDTGMSQEVWKSAGPWLERGHLRGIAIEASWPSDGEGLAQRTRHLTPNSLLLELAKLGRVESSPLDPVTMTASDRETLARSLAKPLEGCRILVIHVKAIRYDEVAAEIAPLREAGLDMILPIQGQEYEF